MKPADQLAGEVLSLGRRTAVAGGHELPAVGERAGNGGGSSLQRPLQLGEPLEGLPEGNGVTFEHVHGPDSPCSIIATAAATAPRPPTASRTWSAAARAATVPSAG